MVLWSKPTKANMAPMVLWSKPPKANMVPMALWSKPTKANMVPMVLWSKTPKANMVPMVLWSKKQIWPRFAGALPDMEDGVTVRGHSRPVMGYNQYSCIGAVSCQALHQRFGRIDVQRTVELVKHED